ncbi:MAG TPA: hypothetical protein VFS40_08570 [Gemmatimonadales bacterium]|nr:hypothetical protein [Gemmatimonadales bacterium]
MLQLLLALALAAPDPRAAALLDSAMARMGGADALRRIERVRTENLTQWQRTTFETRPYADQPSYEWHSDVRDYTIPAWRNTRRYGIPGSAAQTREITDVVNDTVAIRLMQGKWAPLNVAYVDERRELFAFAPERVLLLARAAGDLRLLPDTVIGGLPHARVAATIDRFPATLFLRRGDGLPAMVRWRAAQPNDFGLVEWGEMEAELWYSGWQPTRAGVMLPMQLDVRRVGRPYKRVSVLAMAFDTVAAADSFMVSDSLRSAYLATAVRPMHDVPLDQARVLEGRFAAFGPWTSLNAVKVGDAWLLLETGQAPLVAERATQWLAEHDGGARVAGAVVTATAATNGGVVWLAERKLPVHAAPGAQPILATILRHHRQPATAFTAVARGQWLRVGGDSLWLEPLDLPDAPGAMLVYVPSLQWAYSALAASPLHTQYVLGRLRARGWAVERLGSMRGVTAPVARP